MECRSAGERNENSRHFAMAIGMAGIDAHHSRFCWRRRTRNMASRLCCIGRLHQYRHGCDFDAAMSGVASSAREVRIGHFSLLGAVCHLVSHAGIFMPGSAGDNGGFRRPLAKLRRRRR